MFKRSNQIKRNQYSAARGNLVLVVIFTLINVVLCLLGQDTYFLFSALVPYFIASIGALWGGLYPSEYYADMEITEADFWPTGLVIAFAAAAIVIIAMYFICWLLSKKHVTFMIVALVLFMIDTIMMPILFGISLEWILDYVFHAWVLISLILGIVYYFKNRGAV